MSQEQKTYLSQSHSGLSLILNNFLTNMQEIKNFFDVNLPVVKNRETKVNNKFQEFISSYKKKVMGKEMILVPIEEAKSFEILLEDLRYRHHQPLLCNSSFLILITNFEYIIKAILGELFISYPQSILEKKDFTIEFEDLCQFKDLEEVKKYMINRYLEKIFYKSFSDQQQILLKLFKNKDIPSYINFTLLENAVKERNLLAHNNGIITEAFAKQTGQSLEHVGKKLFISKDTFHKVYQEILFFGLYFSILLGDKIKDKEFLDIGYRHLLFSLLKKKNFSIIKRLYESTHSYAVSDDGKSEIINFINYLLALKNIPEEAGKFESLLKQYKTGQLSDHFKCAICILKNDTNGFLKFFKNSEFTIPDWYEFPIFELVKKDANLEKKALKILEKNTKRQINQVKKSKRKQASK